MPHKVFRKHIPHVHSLGAFVRADATTGLRKHEQMLFCTLFISEALQIHEVFCSFYESSNNGAAVPFRTAKIPDLQTSQAAWERPHFTGLQGITSKGHPGGGCGCCVCLSCMSWTTTVPQLALPWSFPF